MGWRIIRPDSTTKVGTVLVLGRCNWNPPSSYQLVFNGLRDTLVATISDSIMTRQLTPGDLILGAHVDGGYDKIPPEVTLPDSMPVVRFVVKQ